MKLALEDYGDDLDVLAIKCPHADCESTYLHHDEVRVFERSEGTATKMCVTVHGVDAEPDVGDHAADRSEPRFPTVHINDHMQGNPSMSRQGVEVGMWCENCGKRSQLRIAQHKGMTFLSIGRTLYETRPVESIGLVEESRSS